MFRIPLNYTQIVTLLTHPLSKCAKYFAIAVEQHATFHKVVETFNKTNINHNKRQRENHTLGTPKKGRLDWTTQHIPYTYVYIKRTLATSK